jgi:hypothetical protein
MKTFNEFYGLADSFEFASLEYAESCNADAVRALVGPVSGDPASWTLLSTPYAGVLRFAEGIDALRNLANDGDGVQSTSDRDRAFAIVCGLAQLGGVLWMAIVLVVLGLLCVCAPIGSLCCLRAYRSCRNRARTYLDRQRKIDRLLEREALLQDDVDELDIEPSKKSDDVFEQSSEDDAPID